MRHEYHWPVEAWTSLVIKPRRPGSTGTEFWMTHATNFSKASREANGIESGVPVFGQGVARVLDGRIDFGLDLEHGSGQLLDVVRAKGVHDEPPKKFRETRHMKEVSCRKVKRETSLGNATLRKASEEKV